MAKVLQREIELTNQKEDSSSNRNEQEALKLQRQREQQQLEYKNNLRLYEQEFAKAVQAEYPLSQVVLQRLKTYQGELGLNNEVVELTEQPIREPAQVKYLEKLRQQAEQQRREQEQAKYENNLRRYERKLSRTLEAGYPLDDSVRNILKKFQQSLGIRDEDVVPIEQRLPAPKQAEYERQQEAIKREQEQVILENQRLQAESKKQEQRKSSPPISNSDDELSSDRSIDYTRLRDLLKAGEWKQADKETLAVMLKATDGEKQGSLSYDTLENFPCTDLRTIDSLWVKYSNGQYGFSVQKKIWLEVGKNMNAFYTHVGWDFRSKWFLGGFVDMSSINYNGSAPCGHLPLEHLRTGEQVGSGLGLGMFSSLASGLVKCNL